jgi:hypothetical protein
VNPTLRVAFTANQANKLEPDQVYQYVHCSLTSAAGFRIKGVEDIKEDIKKGSGVFS